MKLINCIFLILLMVLLTGCPDDNPVKPDPCAGKKAFKADFNIYEQLWYDSLFVADTVLAGNSVWFIANGDYDSYRWTVGTQEKEYNTKEFAISFNEPYTQVDVRLIATKKPDTLCFPYDDGIDTVIKKVTSVSGSSIEGKSDCALIGKWKGSTDKDPLDTFIVDIFYKMIYYNDGTYYHDFYFIKNLNNGCDAIFHQVDGREWPEYEIRIGYRAAKINGMGWHNKGCNDPYGYVTLNKEHTVITIEYDQRANIKGHYIFKGKKVN